MTTGSSTADLAILLLDSRNGLLEQAKRHTFITTLFGIKNIIVAINKMDLINYDKTVFNKIKNAKVGDIVCLSFDYDIDISSGDYLTEFSTELKYLSEFIADLIWMDFDELNPNKEYIIKFYNNFAMTISIELNFVYNMEFLKEEKCNLNSLKLNQIANANFYLNKKTPMTLYDINRELGSFILIDKFTNMTVGVGMVRSYNIGQKIIPISNNISSQKFNVTAIDRARIKKQKPCCLWLTGLSRSGKSTIANLLDKKLFSLGKHSFILDGDNIRFGLNSDLGFSIEDRYENIRRVGHVAKLMYDSGLIVIASFITPDYKIRDFIKNNIFSNKDFFEIYVKADLEECKKRDPKKLYQKVANGEIKNFTGIDAIYNIPINPDIIINTIKLKPEEAVNKIINILIERNYLNG